MNTFLVRVWRKHSSKKALVIKVMVHWCLVFVDSLDAELRYLPRRAQVIVPHGKIGSLICFSLFLFNR